jgi:hypothetical protein
MDRQSTYSLDLWGEQKSEVSAGQESNNQVQKKLVDFILSFAVDNAFIYRYAVLLSASLLPPMSNTLAVIKSAKTSCQNNTSATSTSHISFSTTKSWHKS